jgi:hypothetical protein
MNDSMSETDRSAAATAMGISFGLHTLRQASLAPPGRYRTSVPGFQLEFG